MTDEAEELAAQLRHFRAGCCILIWPAMRAMVLKTRPDPKHKSPQGVSLQGLGYIYLIGREISGRLRPECFDGIGDFGGSSFGVRLATNG